MKGVQRDYPTQAESRQDLLAGPATRSQPALAIYSAANLFSCHLAPLGTTCRPINRMISINQSHTAGSNRQGAVTLMARSYESLSACAFCVVHAASSMAQHGQHIYGFSV